jgi:hypothetical protein
MPRIKVVNKGAAQKKKVTVVNKGPLPKKKVTVVNKGPLPKKKVKVKKKINVKPLTERGVNYLVEGMKGGLYDKVAKFQKTKKPSAKKEALGALKRAKDQIHGFAVGKKVNTVPMKNLTSYIDDVTKIIKPSTVKVKTK